MFSAVETGLSLASTPKKGHSPARLNRLLPGCTSVHGRCGMDDVWVCLTWTWIHSLEGYTQALTLHIETLKYLVGELGHLPSNSTPNLRIAGSWMVDHLICVVRTCSDDQN